MKINIDLHKLIPSLKGASFFEPFPGFRILFLILLSAFSLGCGRPSLPKVGDAVWAQWSPQLWYHGRAEAVCARGLKVRFDDQDEKCSSFEELAEDSVPWNFLLKSQMHLLAIQSDGTAVPAQILEAKGSQWIVRLPDGKEALWELQRLRLFGIGQ